MLSIEHAIVRSMKEISALYWQAIESEVLFLWAIFSCKYLACLIWMYILNVVEPVYEDLLVIYGSLWLLWIHQDSMWGIISISTLSWITCACWNLQSLWINAQKSITDAEIDSVWPQVPYSSPDLNCPFLTPAPHAAFAWCTNVKTGSFRSSTHACKARHYIPQTCRFQCNKIN